MSLQGHQSGFSTAVILLVVLVVAVMAGTGLVVYQHHKPTSNKTSAATSQTQPTTQPQSTTPTQAQPSVYDGWNTYGDTGYASASGISIKYPSDWKINIPGVKAIGNTTKPTSVINEKVVYLPSTETPQEEWNTCATNVSADACGAAPGDKTLSSKESNVNGLAVYSATMQNSSGTYHVSVIRGNKSTSDGIPFVEFTTSTSDSKALNTYEAIIASASFPS